MPSQPGRTCAADRLPWDRYVRPGAEAALRWNLPDAANDPLFGLPPIPERYYQRLPDNPFRGLTWFAAEHAALFFGRGYQIRELYQQTHCAAHAAADSLLWPVGRGQVLTAGGGVDAPCWKPATPSVYLRRNQQQGLLGTLQAALAEQSRRDDLG